MIPELIKQYVDTGKARFVSREYPLTSIHPLAQKAAEAAVCAGKQGKYWEMHDKLFASQSEWTAQGADSLGLFKKYAPDLGMDGAAFSQCLDQGEAAMDVQADIMAGQAARVSATPTFLINDVPIQGGLSVEAMGRIIDYVAAGGSSPSIVPPEGDFQMLGNQQTAQGAMAAFVDFASPDSAKYTLEVFPQIKATYVDPGKLIYIIHPWADKLEGPSFLGAVAAACGGEQQKFWEMQAELFTNQKVWTSATDPKAQFLGYADKLGLDKAQYETCLGSDWAKLRVQAGAVVGSMYGASTAPTYLFSNGESLDATATWEQFKTTIDSMFGQ